MKEFVSLRLSKQNKEFLKCFYFTFIKLFETIVILSKYKEATTKITN